MSPGNPHKIRKCFIKIFRFLVLKFVFMSITNFGCQLSVTLETAKSILTTIVLFEVKFITSFVDIVHS